MRARIAAIALAAVCSCHGSGDGDLPSAYREVTIPQGILESPDARARGAVLFAQHCALCHGSRGDGHGQRSAGLSTPPRDFTDSAWRQRTSTRRMYFVIREGVRDTAMPSWKSLTEQQCWDLVAHLRSLGERG